MMKITPDILARSTGCTADAAATFAPLLDVVCTEYGITTPARLAAFLAQIGHESGSLRHVVEIWGPTQAQARYEGRADLGNTQPGDGHRFRGRGLIQTTGRTNYRALTQRLRRRLGAAVPDFEEVPESLILPVWAAWSAGDYWDWRNLNELADRGEFEAITRRINGGLNGQPDRLARWKRAQSALAESPAPVNLQEADMPLPAFVAAAMPLIVQSVPKLGRLFGSGSEVAERNVKAAELVVDIVKQATGAPNAQAAAEAVASDPGKAREAAQAIEARWLELEEAGGGGIAGARKADAEFRASGDSLMRSPSLIVALGLIPLVYMVLVSVLFGIGPDWPSDVRAAIATAIVSMIVGGLMGYYFGQTTSRNRTPGGK
jgi:putative chitinase